MTTKVPPRRVNVRGRGNGSEVPMHDQPTLRGRQSPLDPVPPVAPGFCLCGCGATTHARFLLGHQRGTRGPLAEEQDRGYVTPCWIWLGTKAVRGGYGDTGNRGGCRAAHRAIYMEMVGPIPEGLTIDHLCAVTACVNPAHLEPVTLAENTRRQWRDGRADPARKRKAQTHCKRGHEFTPENTHRADGRRYCRACARDRAREARR